MQEYSASDKEKPVYTILIIFLKKLKFLGLSRLNIEL